MVRAQTDARPPRVWWFGALLGAVLSAPLMALLYLGQQLARVPFVPFDLFDWLARHLPGTVITFGIDTMVALIGSLGLGATDQAAKRIEQSMGVVLFVVIAAGFGVVLAALARRVVLAGWRFGALCGFGLFLLVAVLEASLDQATTLSPGVLVLALLLIGWGALLGWLVAPLALATHHAHPDASGLSRRALLLRVTGGSLVLALGAWGLARVVDTRQRMTGAGQALTDLLALPPQPAAPADRIAPAPGTRPEITPNERFYRIDVDTLPPTINGQEWRLQVAGLFDRPRTLSLKDLATYPAVVQLLTIGCISNRVGGDLISASTWTGARLRDVLDDLGVRAEAQALRIQSADGFYESVSLADMRDPRTLLVYGMNDTTLPIDHGFPLRIYIPNRYGMKQPKWITHIEASATARTGYWVERGWDAEARPQIVSIIDNVATNAQANGRIPIGGIAWAGDRGIARVEVQIDDGPWNIATLRVPPLSPLIWVQWRYDWPAQSGSHTVRVRATDGTGALQTGTPHDVPPAGATGYHTVSVQV